MEHLFGRVELRLPNLSFSPGLVAVRRCEGCGTCDRRSWWASPERAAAERRPGWSCTHCGAGHASIVRAWFDTLFADA